jgi:ABC-type uncharacterized transport system ATPase subunit
MLEPGGRMCGILRLATPSLRTQCLETPRNSAAGSELAGHGPAQVRAAGLGYVPEERIRDGVIADFSVADNLMLVESLKRGGFTIMSPNGVSSRTRSSHHAMIRAATVGRSWLRDCEYSSRTRPGP